LNIFSTFFDIGLKRCAVRLKRLQVRLKRLRNRNFQENRVLDLGVAELDTSVN
jgi:hypothetical protein